MAVNEKKRPPPYASGADVDRLFERMRAFEDPGEISTKWVEDSGLAEAQASGIVGVLKWLKVFDENGKTLGFWNALRVPAFREEVLSRLIQDSFAEVFSLVDVPNASKQDLEGAFINAYSAEVPRRPVKCFLALCRHAGIELAAAAEDGRRTGGTKPNEAAKRKELPET